MASWPLWAIVLYLGVCGLALGLMLPHSRKDQDKK